MPIRAQGSLGRYELIREVARSNDIVFEGWDPKTQRRVAIKALNIPSGVSPAQEKDRIQRFEREARAAARLHHGNIVVLFDYGTEDDQPFLVFEFVEAPTLAQILQEEGPLSVQRAVDYAQQLLSAMSYAHSQGVIHRDIKPSNIFILPGDRLKITDLGIARIESEESVTSDGQIFGTPAYMAPEQVKGLLIDRRVDIWAAGVVLYEMLTGIQPFSGGSVLEIGSSVLTNEPDLSRITDMRLREVIGKALTKDVEARFANADQMSAAIKAALDNPAPIAPPVNLYPQPLALNLQIQNPKSKIQKRLLAAVWACALVIGVAGAAAIHWWPSRNTSPQTEEGVPSRKNADLMYADAYERHSLHQMANSSEFRLLPENAQLDRLDTWFRSNMSRDYVLLTPSQREALLARLRQALASDYLVATNNPPGPDLFTLNPSSSSPSTTAPPIIPPIQSGQMHMPGPYTGAPARVIVPPATPVSSAREFDVGATEADVRSAQGKPDAIEYTPGRQRMFYGASNVTIINGRVAGYEDKGNLKVRHINTQATVTQARPPSLPPQSEPPPRTPPVQREPPIVYHAVDMNDLAILRSLNFHATSVTVHNGIREYSGPDGTVYIR